MDNLINIYNDKKHYFEQTIKNIESDYTDYRDNIELYAKLQEFVDNINKPKKPLLRDSTIYMHKSSCKSLCKLLNIDFDNDAVEYIFDHAEELVDILKNSNKLKKSTQITYLGYLLSDYKLIDLKNKPGNLIIQSYRSSLINKQDLMPIKRDNKFTMADLKAKYEDAEVCSLNQLILGLFVFDIPLRISEYLNTPLVNNEESKYIDGNYYNVDTGIFHLVNYKTSNLHGIVDIEVSNINKRNIKRWYDIGYKYVMQNKHNKPLSLACASKYIKQITGYTARQIRNQAISEKELLYQDGKISDIEIQQIANNALHTRKTQRYSYNSL